MLLSAVGDVSPELETGDSLDRSVEVFVEPGMSPSLPLTFLSLRLKRPLSMPFFSFFFLSSLLFSVLSEYMLSKLDPRSLIKSFEGLVEVLESSRSKLGVRVIFLVSTLSSLKNESVFLSVPFRDRPGPTERLLIP
jgi:hypothetical protein